MTKLAKLGWSALCERVAAARERPFAIVGVGECSLDAVSLVERLPHAGEKIAARAHLQLGGGQIATAMVAAQRLGVAAQFVGAIGDDLAGRAIADGLREEGVDTSALVVVRGAASRTAAIFVEPSGERTIVEHRDAALASAVLAVPRDAAAIVHADATVAPATLEAIFAAQDVGAILSCDVERPNATAHALLARADVAVVSEHYLRARGTDDEVAVLALDRELPGVVIVTRGERGAYAVVDGAIVHAPRFAVDVVDTTACGDTFRGALLVALCEQQELPYALRFASAAAALKCGDYGRRGCPRRDAVVKLLD